MTLFTHITHNVCNLRHDVKLFLENYKGKNFLQIRTFPAGALPAVCDCSAWWNMGTYVLYVLLQRRDCLYFLPTWFAKTQKHTKTYHFTKTSQNFTKT